jgi:hypothetical protein
VYNYDGKDEMKMDDKINNKGFGHDKCLVIWHYKKSLYMSLFLFMYALFCDILFIFP